MRLLLLLCPLLLLGGCDGRRLPRPTSSLSRAERDRATREAQLGQLNALRERINRAEEEWGAKGITSYELEVRYEQINTIRTKVTVRDRQVVEPSCQEEVNEGQSVLSPSCELFWLNPAMFTIPGLFIMAREEVGDARSHQLPADRVIRIELDLEDRYPKRLRWLQPEPFEWEVTSFRPLD